MLSEISQTEKDKRCMISLACGRKVVKVTNFQLSKYWKAEHRRIGCFWTVVLEKTPESPLDCKKIKPDNPERNQSWIFIGRTDTEAETPILWPPDAKSWLIEKDWCWEGLGAGGEGDDRGCDGWMASPTRWTWVCVNSGTWWWTGRCGVLWFMGSQRVGHDWETELNRTECIFKCKKPHVSEDILLVYAVWDKFCFLS